MFQAAWKNVACYLRSKELEINRFCAQNRLRMSISSMNIPAIASFSNPDISSELEHVVGTMLKSTLQNTCTPSFNVVANAAEISPVLDDTQTPFGHVPSPRAQQMQNQHLIPSAISHDEQMRILLDEIEQHHQHAFTKI